MSFSLTTDENFENPVMTVYDPESNEEKVITGISSFQIKHSTKGKNSGTKITVSMLTPSLNKTTHQLKCSVAKYNLPEDLAKILKFANFWESNLLVEDEATSSISVKA